LSILFNKKDTFIIITGVNDMSKKNLLKEATVRRFMKLADLGPLAEEFLPETEEVVNEEEETTEEITEEVAEEEVVEEEVVEQPIAEEEHSEELEADLEVEEEPEELAPEGESVSLEDLKRGLQALVDAVPGLELEVEGDEAPEMEADLELADEPMEEPPAEEEPAMRDYGAMEEGEEVADKIVEKVMERIESEEKRQIAVDVLAERIMKRLSEKK
tara:strand:- start:413 stop:1060 length:648 start_codon:yes stop_codon:yes gene_type:complete